NRYRESAANDDRTECIIILEQFRTYTKTHFQREEAVMAACAYPGLTNHVQVHGLLIKQVEKIQMQLNRDELETDEPVAFLCSWWIDHIQCMDRAYAPYCEGNAELIKQTLDQAGPVPEPEG
ncbi:MAG: hemerythrin family protein, partial [Gammaproteobacteria bacterium]|nr:hemerythrin family protein [Gammaproteobacteria bacterium]